MDKCLRVHTFFLVSFRPVLKQGPKSLTVRQVFLGGGTCKRLESACLDKQPIVILRVVCARALVFGVSLSLSVSPSVSFFFRSSPLSFGRGLEGPRAGSRQRQHSAAVRITVTIYTIMTKQNKL